MNRIKTIDDLFEIAVHDWVEQGRSEEEIYGVNNFFSGRGLKLKSELLQLLEEVAPEKEDIYAAYTTNKIIEELEELLSEAEWGDFKGDGINARANIVFSFKLKDRVNELKALNHRKEQPK